MLIACQQLVWVHGLFDFPYYRFDLIYLVLDQPNEYHDRKLAKHIISLYYQEDDRKETPKNFIPMAQLTAYISFARKSIHPVLTDEASDRLVDRYVEMRRIGQSQTQRKVAKTTKSQHYISSFVAHHPCSLGEKLDCHRNPAAAGVADPSFRGAGAHEAERHCDSGGRGGGHKADDRCHPNCGKQRWFYFHELVVWLGAVCSRLYFCSIRPPGNGSENRKD